MRDVLIRIQQEAEGMRVWGGMGWKWQNYRAKRIHDLCTKALAELEEARTQPQKVEESK